MIIIKDGIIDLEGAIQSYWDCPYTQLSIADACGECELNQGFVVYNPENKRERMKTTICRMVEVLDNTLAMIRED